MKHLLCVTVLNAENMKIAVFQISVTQTPHIARHQYSLHITPKEKDIYDAPPKSFQGRNFSWNFKFQLFPKWARILNMYHAHKRNLWWLFTISNLVFWKQLSVTKIKLLFCLRQPTAFFFSKKLVFMEWLANIENLKSDEWISCADDFGNYLTLQNDFFSRE